MNENTIKKISVEDQSLSATAGGGLPQAEQSQDANIGSRARAAGTVPGEEHASAQGGLETEDLPLGKAARPRGGGIERESSANSRDYRRFSLTSPPEHQPFYQPKHAAQLPTHEHPSGSAVGVGSLPGSNKEFGVARLPDELGNTNPHVYSGSTISHAAATNPFKSTLKGNPKAANLPSTEVPSGSKVGVGSLPGRNTEPGVATLPEERGHDGRPLGSLRTGFENYSPEEGAARFQQANHHEHGHVGHGHKHHVLGANVTRSSHGRQASGGRGHGRRMSTGAHHSGTHGDVHEQIHHFFDAGDHHAMEKVDLPTREELSGSYCGVGSLPGSRMEGAVGLLPYERRRHLDNEVDVAQLLPSTETPSISYGGVGSLPGRRDEAGVAVLPDERIHPSEFVVFDQHAPGSNIKGAKAKGRRHSAVHFDRPTTEKISGSRVGVGSLPGGHKEEGVAIFPYERVRHMDNETAVEELLPTTEARTPFAYGGVGSLPGKKDESGIALTPEERVHPESGILGAHHGRGPHARTPHHGRKQSSSRHSHQQGSNVQHWEGMGNDPHGLMKERYSDIRTKLTPKEMYRAHFQEGVNTQAMPKVDLPTTEEVSGSRVGVGSLPGRKGEEGVAILPYERLRHLDNEVAVEELMPTTEAHTPFAYGGVGNLPGSRREKGVAMTPEERAHPEDEILTLHHTGGKKSSMGKGHHEPHFWKGMGNEPHGLTALRYEGIRTKLTPEEMYRVHFQEGLDHHVTPKVDLPTREEVSGSRCGVGSLPGGRNEEGVAILPYERVRHLDNEVAEEELMPSTEAQTPFNYGGVGNLPGKRSEQRVALLPEERLHPADRILNSHLPPRMDQLPTHEHISGSKVGVGSLPGPRNEKGVAITPEERRHSADQILMTHHGKKKRLSGRGVSGGQQSASSGRRGASGQGVGRTASQQHDPTMVLAEAEREALRQIEERTEMMRQTMGRVGENVRGAVETVTKNLEDMGIRMRRRFGLEHPGGAPMPASEFAVGGRRVSGASGDHGLERTHSAGLSPTAPEFVPHWAMDVVGGVKGGIERVVHGVEENVPGVKQLERVVHDVEESVESYITPWISEVDDEHIDDDLMSEDDEDALQKVHEAERLLERAREDEERAGIRLGTPTHAIGVTSASRPARQGQVHGQGHGQGVTHSPRMSQEALHGTSMVMMEEGSLRGDRNAMRGVGGVEFNRGAGREGEVLPGFPTQQGMGQLMSDRLSEDRMTSPGGRSGVKTPTNSPVVPREDPGRKASGIALGSAVGATQMGGVYREDTDLSTASVRGSTSDLGEGEGEPEEKFTGNRTPTMATSLRLESLGQPLGAGGVGLDVGKTSGNVHHGGVKKSDRDSHGVQHAIRKGIN